MSIIDFHNHFYPPEYLRGARSRRPSSVKVTDGRQKATRVIHYPGDYNIACRGHRDIAYRDEMSSRETGVDSQVISLHHAGNSRGDAEAGGRAGPAGQRRLRARSCETRSERFTALATLPLNDPTAPSPSSTRAFDELGLPRRHAVQQRQRRRPGRPHASVPLYERAHELERRALHPPHVSGRRRSHDRVLADAAGRVSLSTRRSPRPTSSSAASPSVPRTSRWVLGHLGGAIPYLAERLDRGYAFPECRAKHQPAAERVSEEVLSTIR